MNHILNKTVIEILKQHLIDNGFDGLVNGYAECGCDLSDLQPCDASFADCKPAYKRIDPSGECDFLFFEEKQAQDVRTLIDECAELDEETWKELKNK